MSWNEGGFSGTSGNVQMAADGVAVTDVIEVTAFTFNPTSAIDKYGSNKSQGFKRGVAGTRDSSGTVEVRMDKAAGPPFWDGDEVDLKLIVGPAVTDYITIGALIEGAPINVNMDTGETVRFTYNWEGIEPWVAYGILAPTGSSSGN